MGSGGKGLLNAAIMGTIGYLTGGVGLAAAGALLGGAQGYSNAENQKKQEQLQKQANAQQEQLAKLEAGKAPEQETNLGNTGISETTKKSALRRTLLTRNRNSTKFGD